MVSLPPLQTLEAGLMDTLFGCAGQKTLPLTPNRDFYITSYDLTPSIQLSNWTLKVQGLCRNPLELTFEDILKRPRQEIISTLECIGNPVGGYSIGTARWAGISMKSLLEEAKIDPKGIDLALFGEDGYSDSISLERAQQENVVLAYHMNGVSLPPDHGYPLRLIVPGIYGMKNVKWINRLELVPYDYKGHWQPEGWPDEAPVKLASRIDLPGDRETITTTPYPIQGIAFNGVKKITQVEVSTNGGKEWGKAIIRPRLSPFAWVHWDFPWEISKKGEYTLLVRAWNEDGAVQTMGSQARSSTTTEIHAITVLVSR